MPMRVTSVAAAGEVHASPFIGPVNHTIAIRVDVSEMTSDEVDSYGYLKPGVILTREGALVDSTHEGYGVVVEAVKIADNNGAALSTAADVDVAIALICVINRAIVEDNLGRSLTNDELSNTSPAIVITNTTSESV